MCKSSIAEYPTICYLTFVISIDTCALTALIVFDDTVSDLDEIPYINAAAFFSCVTVLNGKSINDSIIVDGEITVSTIVTYHSLRVSSAKYCLVLDQVSLVELYSI